VNRVAVPSDGNPSGGAPARAKPAFYPLAGALAAGGGAAPAEVAV